MFLLLLLGRAYFLYFVLALGVCLFLMCFLGRSFLVCLLFGWFSKKGRFIDLSIPFSVFQKSGTRTIFNAESSKSEKSKKVHKGGRGVVALLLNVFLSLRVEECSVPYCLHETRSTFLTRNCA